MRHFLRLAQGLDVLPVVNALATQPDLWSENRLRTTFPGSPHAACDDIWLLFNKIPTDDPGEVIDDVNVIPYRAWCAVPQVRPLVFDLMRRIEGAQLGRVLITRLPPGKTITPHVDQGTPATFYRRYQGEGGASGAYLSGSTLRGMADINQRYGEATELYAANANNAAYNDWYTGVAGDSRRGSDARTSISSSGQNAADTASQLYANQGTNLANLYTEQGRINAERDIGIGSAWATGIEGVGNAISGAAGGWGGWVGKAAAGAKANKTPTWKKTPTLKSPGYKSYG